MITDPSYFALFKRRSLAEQALNLDDKYRIFEALYEEARRLGSFGEQDLLLGIEDDVHLAAALNANVSSPPR